MVSGTIGGIKADSDRGAIVTRIGIIATISMDLFLKKYLKLMSGKKVLKIIVTILLAMVSGIIITNYFTSFLNTTQRRFCTTSVVVLLMILVILLKKNEKDQF